MKIHFIQRTICTFAVVATLCSLQFVISYRPSVIAQQTALAQQTKRYKIYCVDGKVHISNRELDEMKAMRGSRVCLLESYDNLNEATQAAKRYGGVGATCSCQ